MSKEVGGAALGCEAGALIGSILPGFGTIGGCLIGADLGDSAGPLVGAVCGFINGGAYHRNGTQTGQADGPEPREQLP